MEKKELLKKSNPYLMEEMIGFMLTKLREEDKEKFKREHACDYNDIICIYGIVRKSDNKIIYVGKTNNLLRRMYCHKHHRNSTLKVDIWMRENPDDWEYAILKTFENDPLSEWEEYYIKEYDTINTGLNEKVAQKEYRNNTKYFGRKQHWKYCQDEYPELYKLLEDYDFYYSRIPKELLEDIPKPPRIRQYKRFMAS